jgi:SAM-dependent methyltransferase
MSSDRAAKSEMADLLRAEPARATPEQAPELLRLVRDPDVNPAAIERAGWHVVTLSGDIEHDDLALALLEEAIVTVPAVEQALTQLRRRLLLDGAWQDCPKTTTALIRQAALNGGAWLFDDEERARFTASPMEQAYVVRHEPAAARDNAVAQQYEGYPYPSWTRITRRPPRVLSETIKRLDPDGRDTIPAAPDILVAGCGTGREVAAYRDRYPDARITAIDLSTQSLRYAAERVGGVTFHHHDLHDIAVLGRRFDLISAIGVLHHLPDPEKGWAALAGVLKPGGVMHVMLYSRIARLRVLAARARLADLAARPMDDDVLREARRRMMADGTKGIVGSRDFFSLAGVHDLLLHRHEDAFDIPRIGCALDALGLELLAFELPNSRRRARYRAEHPHDPLFRDRSAWAALETTEPTLFSGMYGLWCRSP